MAAAGTRSQGSAHSTAVLREYRTGARGRAICVSCLGFVVGCEFFAFSLACRIELGILVTSNRSCRRTPVSFSKGQPAELPARAHLLPSRYLLWRATMSHP